MTELTQVERDLTYLKHGVANLQLAVGWFEEISFIDETSVAHAKNIIREFKQTIKQLEAAHDV